MGNKYIKEDVSNPINDAVCAAEKILRDAGISLSIISNSIRGIHLNSGVEFEFYDTDDREPSCRFPRITDSERLRVLNR